MKYWEYPSLKKHLIVLFCAISLFACMGIYWLVRVADGILIDTIEGEAEQIARFMNRKVCDREFCRVLVASPKHGGATQHLPGFSNLAEMIEESRRNFGIRRICLFDVSGRLVLNLQPGADLPTRPVKVDPSKLERHHSELRTTPDGRKILDTYVPVRHRRGHHGPMVQIGAFKISRDITPSPVALASRNRNGILIAMAVFLGLFLFAFVMFDRVQRLIVVKERALREALEKAEENYEALKTARLKLEQSEKLSTLGTIISGIAHELNNPLTTILGYAQLIPYTPAVQEKGLRIIEEGAIRCKKIIDNLLVFARQHKAERTLVSPAEVIERTYALFEYKFRTHNVAFLATVAPELRDVKVAGDFHKLQQVFINLFNNALQAMEPQRHGELSCLMKRNGDVLYIEIADSGPGIPEEILRRIFDPFFTTKETGQGTGLGLSISFGIIRSHGGQIYARNRPGGGASFVIELSIAQPEEVSTTSQPPSLPAIPRPDVRRVLVVDDEPPILQLCTEVLGSRGFDVRGIADGEAAIALLRRKAFDVVLCDLRMPGTDGREIYAFLQRNAPELLPRLIFMSGDTLSRETISFIEETHAPCLQKPFSLSDLLAAIDTVIEEHARRDRPQR